MNLEQRLQHAARDLRNLHVEPPPFDIAGAPGSRSASVRRIPALVAPVLFVLGGLVMASGGLRTESVRHDKPTPTQVPVPTSITPAGEAVEVAAEPVTVGTTPNEELRIIADLVAEVGPPASSFGTRPPIVRPGPTGVV